MTDLRITCIRESEGRITHVGVQANGVRSITTVIAWIDRGHTFFTEENGIRADVFKKQHPETKRWFLTTDPDSITENNLDFLDECS